MDDAKTSCPTDEALTRFFRREAGRAEIEALADHVRLCPRCRIRFEALRLVDAEIRSRQGEFLGLAENSLREMEAAAGNAPSRARRQWAPKAAAALLTLAAAVILGLVFKPGPPDETLRSPVSAVLRLNSPAGRQAQAPTVFVWSAVPEADYYSFDLIDDALETIVASTTVTSPSFTLPAAARAKLRPGRTYIWSVDARGDDRMRIEFSRQSFFLAGD